MMISIAGREIEEDDEQAEALLMSAHEKKFGRSVSAASQTPSSRSPISASTIS